MSMVRFICCWVIRSCCSRLNTSTYSSVFSRSSPTKSLSTMSNLPKSATTIATTTQNFPSSKKINRACHHCRFSTITYSRSWEASMKWILKSLTRRRMKVWRLMSLRRRMRMGRRMRRRWMMISRSLFKVRTSILLVRSCCSRNLRCWGLRRLRSSCWREVFLIRRLKRSITLHCRWTDQNDSIISLCKKRKGHSSSSFNRSSTSS